MTDYREYIFLINKAVEDFSNLLKPEYQLPKIDDEKINNPKISWNLLQVGWNDTMFPGDESPGVYLIFGKNTITNQIGIYIGKSSYKSLIGNRLYQHLNKGKVDRNYIMTNKSKEEFKMEFVTTVPMKNFPFLSSALEEFLIDQLQEQNIHLLNSVGKR